MHSQRGRSVGQPKATHRRQTPCQNFVRFNFKVSNAVRPNETLNEDGISCKSIDRCHRLVEMRKKCLGYCQKPVLMSSLSEQPKGYTSPLDPWIYARKNGKPSAYASLNHSQYTWASSNPAPFRIFHSKYQPSAAEQSISSYIRQPTLRTGSIRLHCSTARVDSLKV